MNFKPLIDLRGTTMIRAFILNALVTAAIAALAIEFRYLLDEQEETKQLSRTEKALIIMLVTFLHGLVIYIVVRYILGFGDGLLTKGPQYPFFL